MVYKLQDWFIFEPGDVVSVLPEGKKGVIVDTEEKSLDFSNRNQIVTVRFRKGLTQNVSSRSLELVRAQRVKNIYALSGHLTLSKNN